MSSKENNPSLLSKMAKFVRNPTTNWTDLDKQDPEPDAGYSKQALKEMIERKRQNDFVRKREFDQLRKLRSRDPGSNPELAGRPSYFQSSLPSNPNERAMTIKKIDEIEAQMSNQWWQGKNDSVAKGGAARSADTARKAEPPVVSDEAPDDQGYAPTRLSPMRAERVLSGRESSDFPPTQDNSDFGPDSGTDRPPDSMRRGPDSSRGPGPQSVAPASSGFNNSRTPAVELTEGFSDADLEEAAIRFANGDDAGAESALQGALDNPDANVEQANGWALALLDLYRATGQLAPFELASIEYARRFGRSGPAWFSMPEMLGLKNGSTVVRTVPSRLVEEPVWSCPALFGRAGVDDLRLSTANVPAPWFLDWSGLSRLEPDAIEPLATLFAEWCSTPVELRFAGARELEKALRACAPSGDRFVSQANWKLRLDALRIMRLQDEFELVALDYCVTYEVSPPSWQDARCSYQSRNGNGSQAGADAGDGAHQEGPNPGNPPAGDRQAATVLMGLESMQAAVAALSGIITGEATESLEALERARNGSSSLVVSCANLIRVDFSAAGSILNWAATLQAEGCQLQFRDAHRLVAAFFGVIGINEHARILVLSK